MTRLFIADYTKQLYLFEDFQPKDESDLASQCDSLDRHY